ncbi:MAG: polysaccharide biosynthesis tyrosine autokinase [Microcoleaceae cyanobacterium MO_207.B10]|nr:polysaccharide biosynthesis tyrosine autokinase [Microcoleaceae cyanobacterium MO_207.B10]
MKDSSKQLQQLPSQNMDDLSDAPKKGLNIRPLIMMVWRNAWIIIGITGAFGYAGYRLAKQSQPEPLYKGSFQILLEPITSEARMTEPTALTRIGGIPNEKTFSFDYPTQLELLKSQKLLSQVVGEVQTEYPELEYIEFRKQLSLERVGGKSRLDRTSIIQIIYEDNPPDKVKFILEKLLDKYLKYSLEERRSSIGEGVKFINTQLPPLQKRVEEMQLKIQSLQEKYDLINPQATGQELFAQIRQIENQKVATQIELQEQRTLYDNLTKQLGLRPEEAIAASALSQNQQYNQLLQQVQEIETKIAVESVRFQADNPQLKSLNKQLQELEILLDQEIGKILGENLVDATTNPQVMNFQDSIRLSLIGQLIETRNKIGLLEARSQGIESARNALTSQAEKFPSISREYSDLVQKLEIANNSLNTLLTQREKLQIEKAQDQIPWEVVAEPQLFRDGKGEIINFGGGSNKNIFIGLVGAGGILGVGLALLIGILRNRFEDAQDVKDASDLPILGEIPRLKIRNSTKKSDIISDASTTSSTFSLEEFDSINQNDAKFLAAFDSLCANLKLIYSNPPISSLTITSAEAGDGKSTVALHLAQAAAFTGQRVLLVDANLHFPQIHNLLDLPNYRGLSDLLFNNIEDTHHIIQISPIVSNLFVLTSGTPNSNGARMLSSNRMQYLMDEFQASFDLVIYDTPPLLDFIDANFIGANSDGILMVTAIRKTKYSALKQALGQLNHWNLFSLGVVATHVSKRRISYQNYGQNISEPLTTTTAELPPSYDRGKATLGH